MFFSRSGDKLWYIQTVEYYSVLKRNELSSHEKTWRKQMYTAKWKQPFCKSYILYDSNYMTFWKRQNYGDNKKISGGFPGGAVVGSPPAGAGDTGSSPGLGGSHMPRSGWAREPQLLSLRVWSLCSAAREAAVVRGPRTSMKGGPHLPQLEKALAQRRRPNTAINK